LLFHRERDVEASNLPYLDGYYAQRLAYIHKNIETPLAFLDPGEVRKLLEDISDSSRESLQIFSPWLAWMWRVPILHSLLLRSAHVRRLDFAFITHVNGSISVLLVSKENETLQVVSINDSRRTAYQELVSLIKKRIYQPEVTPPKIDPAHDFVTRYFP
ncbi:MAG: hypothetical protein LAP21_25230, partial [Acidobacteriia bacterium]|nr:hypothetical protein [Terriglobia bacterium]